MSLKNYVYSHPVNVFIIGRLGLSVEVFCELYGFKVLLQSFKSTIK